ncbi:hypothetical protein [Salipiger sp. PrR002]|uniref:hypothetical protein n=1 Tax=Salipiger sp. PrR002 TaxID=2706489 RepID=UPI0013BCEB14|nr:hypothetical protein [Salipiger sp. PrR002]NDV98376.1 hypothetical protein [Salipiger sp. PrR002]NDW55088.1 hypothetical protein [Salipiger sp. PrR004]
MIRTLLLALMCCAASPALALKCLSPDVARDVRAAAEGESSWLAVNGMLETGPVPRHGGEVPARIWGWALGEEGFTRPFDSRITLRSVCFGPWCGKAASGKLAALLKREGDRYVLITDPCGANLWPEPRKRQIETLRRACLEAGCN